MRQWAGYPSVPGAFGHVSLFKYPFVTFPFVHEWLNVFGWLLVAFRFGGQDDSGQGNVERVSPAIACVRAGFNFCHVLSVCDGVSKEYFDVVRVRLCPFAVQLLFRGSSTCFNFYNVFGVGFCSQRNFVVLRYVTSLLGDQDFDVGIRGCQHQDGFTVTRQVRFGLI